MKTNADLTIYCKSVDPATRTEVWTAHQVRGVLWEERKGANVVRSGLMGEENVRVFIPYECRPADLEVGDVMVRGLVWDEIGSEFTITDLKQKYESVATVRSVYKAEYGSRRLWHWEVGGEPTKKMRRGGM